MTRTPYRFYPQVENDRGHKSEQEVILEAVSKRFNPREIIFDDTIATFNESSQDVAIRLGTEYQNCTDISQWSRIICNFYKTTHMKKDNKSGQLWMPHDRTGFDLVMYIIHENMMKCRQREYDEIFELPSQMLNLRWSNNEYDLGVLTNQVPLGMLLVIIRLEMEQDVGSNN